jgi:hypothetical protein
MKSKSDDFQIEQQIFLGGQVSRKHKQFMDMAKLSPEYAELCFLISHMDEWEKETDTKKVALEILQGLGEIDFLRSTTELTRLSMILGDTRERYNVKKAIDELRKNRSDTPT